MHNVLSGISFICGLVGVAGIAGAIECGTGYCASTVLIIIALVSGVCAGAEDGNIRRQKWNTCHGKKPD